ncbi:MAG: AAA family ATPase [Phycisphaerae bacterium]|nr:AAA family ATPase [Phycisphaerae bacterium]
MSLSPFELVLSKLPEARPINGTSQKAWKACCPAHADDKPSLCVSLGEEGRALVHCYAGCPPEAVVAALGLSMADLMPLNEREKVRRSEGQKVGESALRDGSLGANRAVRPSDFLHFSPSSSPDDYETAEQAIDAMERRLGPCSRTWVYHDDCEDPVGFILRWDTDRGKEIRPVSRHGNRWVLGGMATPRPLYRLVELLKRRDERVYVTEGEKAADAGISLGLLATTSPHGSASARKADWRVLAGRDVVLLPDNDDAGRRYAQDVASILLGLNPPATVRIVALPELEPKGDLYDWVERHDAVESKDLRTRLERLVDAEPLTRDSSLVASRSDAPSALDASCEGRDPSDAGRRGTPDRVMTNARTRTPDVTICARPIVTCVADAQRTPVRWLWPRRMALGRISLLVGRPGEGKSVLTIDMAAHVSRGLPWPDGTACPQGSVLLIGAEDDLGDTIYPRLENHGADLGRIHLMHMVERPDPDGGWYEDLFTLADVKTLEAALQERPDCRLVVVDPIGSFLGGRTDAHRDNEVRSVLMPVSHLAEQYGCAVVVVAHRRKSPGGHADDMAMGSRAFTGVARAVLHLTRDAHNKERRLLLSGKNNLAKEQPGLAFTIETLPDDTPRIRWESEPIDLTADEALRDENAPPSDAKRTALDDAMAWLQDTLAEGPLPSEEIRDQAQADGISETTLKRAKQRLGIRAFREVRADDAAWFWSLPQEPEGTQSRGNQEVEESLAASTSEW